MSGESRDIESISNDNNKRSHSLLRQVHAKFDSRNRLEIKGEPLSALLLREKRRTKKNLIPKIPISFPYRSSLFNQVKSYIIGKRNSHRIISSTRSDDYQSIPSIILNLDKSSTSENNQNSIDNETDLSPPGSPINTVFEDTVDNVTALDDSLNMTVENEGQGQTNGAHQTSNSSLSPSLLNLNKFKDQINQRARTVMDKASSVIGGPPPSTANPSDPVYWTEVLIEKGKDLAPKDVTGTSDPYVKVFYGTEDKYTSSIIPNELDPVWNEKFTIFTEDLNIPLYFRIYDRDRIGRDEPMGVAKLDLWKLPFERLYAATLELEEEQRTDSKVGSLKISVLITPKTVEFRDEVLRSLAKQAQSRGGRPGSANGVIVPRRTIDVFIIQARNLISNRVDRTCSPYIKLKFASHKKYRTQTIKDTVNPIWHQSFMFDTTANELAPLELMVMDDTSSAGDLIGRALCNLAHLAEEKTHRLSIEIEDGTGIIELFITITATTALEEATSDGDSSANIALDIMPSKLTEADYKHYSLFSTIRTLPNILDIGKVEIKIFQARDLSAKDLMGKSDPFCIVQLDTSRLRTHTIYKTLNPIWNKSFVMPAQDIHSIMELTIYDEDTDKNTEFIGKVAIPLLAIKNGEKKWLRLKDKKCLLPVKGAIEIEATFLYTDIKGLIRTFNPRQTAYYQEPEKFSPMAIKEHVTRIQNMVSGIVNWMIFIDYCFHWEQPFISFTAFMAALVIVWNFELYMLPCTLLLLLGRSAIKQYRHGRLGKSYAPLIDETVAPVVQAATLEEDILEADLTTKEAKKSFLSNLQGLTDTVVEVQGYIDMTASSLERIKNLFNFSVPWLTYFLIIVLVGGALGIDYVPFRLVILGVVANKFTKCFRKPKGYIDNNELADFFSRIPSDPELLKYRELKVHPRATTTAKQTKKPANKK